MTIGAIRPEVRKEVDQFLDLRAQIRSAEKQLRTFFARRMAMEGMTPAELALVMDALEWKD